MLPDPGQHGDSGIALDHGVLMVTVTAGIAIWHIFHNSGKYNGACIAHAVLES